MNKVHNKKKKKKKKKKNNFSTQLQTQKTNKKQQTQKNALFRRAFYYQKRHKIVDQHSIFLSLFLSPPTKKKKKKKKAMTDQQPTSFSLANGVKIPSIGFGCAFGNWTNPDEPILFLPEKGWVAMRNALDVGYSHFDTALLYRTHRILGDLLGKEVLLKGKDRKEVFLVTKVGHPPAHLGLGRRGHFMDYEDERLVEEEYAKEVIWNMFERCLEDLGVGYVDLLLLHWPGNLPDGKKGEEGREERRKRGAKVRRNVWKAMEGIYQSKQARAIGVSNYNQRHLLELIEGGEGEEKGCEVKPMVNQIEVNPYCQPRELIDLCKKHDVVVEAYSPFGSGATGVLQDELVKELGEKYGKNVGQVIVRWLLQEGIVVLPKSGSKERAKGNIDVFDFCLNEEEMEKMKNLDKGKSCLGVDLDLID